MEKKLGVVILNYNSYWETIECVEATLKQEYTDYQIVIVENGSANDSYEILNNRFSGMEKVTLIKSEENLGFARGNNLGIRYAREKLGCNFIFVANSDILFEEDLFAKVLETDSDGIGVLSPVVYTIDNELSLPTGRTNNVYLKFFRTVFDICITSLKQNTTISKLHAKIKGDKHREYDCEAVNMTYPWDYSINGCAFFLTEHFFEYYTQLYPNTFLYWEEMNLLIYMQKVGLKAKIVETVSIIHKEGRSTEEVGEVTNVAKRLRHSRKSMAKSWFMYFMPYSLIKKFYN